MRSKLLMIILISLLSLPLAAQYNNCPEELVPKYDPKKKMWGFANLLGFWEIEPYYTNVSAFTDNKAIVQRGLLFGAIDCNGNTIIQPKYQAVSPFRNGKAWVMENNKWGMVDDKGKMWISPQFSEITPIPLSDFSWVNKNGSWGLYNEETKRFSCEPQYQMAKVVSPNCSMVQVKTGLFGFINHVNCNFLVEPNITSVKKVNTSTVLFEMNGKWGVFNYDGRIKANAEFDEISLGSPNLLIVSKAGKSGLMDLSGKILLPFDYDYIGEYQNGLFPVKQGGKFGYANLLGKIYVEPKYEYAGAFKNKQAVVKENGKFGVIDMSRSYIMQPLYQEIIQHGYHDFYLVKEAGQEGVSIFTLKGSKLIEQTFDKVFTEDSSELVRVVRDKRVLFLNVRAGKIPINESFEEANAFTNNYAMVKKLGKWGIIDATGKTIVPIDFDKIEYRWFTNRLVFQTFRNGLTGIYSQNGKEIIPAEYQILTSAAPNYLKVRKNDLFGVLKTDGSVVCPPEYEFLSGTESDTVIPDWPAIVKKGGKFGLINEKAELVYPVQADELKYIGESFFAFKQKKKYQLMDIYGKIYDKVKFDSITSSGNGKIAVYNGKKWGYVNSGGKQEIAFDFEAAEIFKDRIAVVKKNGKFGLINTTGAFIVNPEYDAVTEERGVRILIKNGEKYKVEAGGALTRLL